MSTSLTQRWPNRDPRAVADPIDVSGEALLGRNVVLGSVALLILIRLGTEVVPVLPRAANFIDVPIVFLVMIFALIRPARMSLVPAPRFSAVIFAFSAVWALSVLVNLQRISVAPATLQLYGFLAPLLFFTAAYKLWPVGHSLALSRLFVGLMVVQFPVIVLIDLPRFIAERNPDDISGTFGENAYQLVFLLLVCGALVAGIAAFERRRATARLAAPLLLGAFVVIFLAQYRALLPTTAFSVLLVLSFVSIGRRGRGLVRVRGIVIGLTLVGILVVALAFVGTRFPVTKFIPTLQVLADDPGTFFEGGKVRAARNIGSLYAEDASYVLLGTGPGTYSSRAWYTFHQFDSSSDSNVAGSYVSSIQGGSVYTTDVSDRYVVPLVESQEVILGSKSLSNPLSSYLSLLGELGVTGFALILGAYLAALVMCWRMTLTTIREGRLDDPLPAVLIAATISIFVLLQMAFLENWLEVTRVTIPAWLLVAVATKEFRARRMGSAAV